MRKYSKKQLNMQHEETVNWHLLSLQHQMEKSNQIFASWSNKPEKWELYVRQIFYDEEMYPPVPKECTIEEQLTFVVKSIEWNKSKGNKSTILIDAFLNAIVINLKSINWRENIYSEIFLRGIAHFLEDNIKTHKHLNLICLYLHRSWDYLNTMRIGDEDPLSEKFLGVVVRVIGKIKAYENVYLDGLVEKILMNPNHLYKYYFRLTYAFGTIDGSNKSIENVAHLPSNFLMQHFSSLKEQIDQSKNPKELKIYNIQLWVYQLQTLLIAILQSGTTCDELTKKHINVWYDVKEVVTQLLGIINYTSKLTEFQSESKRIIDLIEKFAMKKLQIDQKISDCFQYLSHDSYLSSNVSYRVESIPFYYYIFIELVKIKAKSEIYNCSSILNATYPFFSKINKSENQKHSNSTEFICFSSSALFISLLNNYKLESGVKFEFSKQTWEPDPIYFKKFLSTRINVAQLINNQF
jgi:hypothetical protein